MRNKQLFFIDENISTNGLSTHEDLIHVKRGSQDPDIIKAFNVIRNPIVFFTRNPKDFKGKLKTIDQIVNVGKKFTQKLLDEYIPKATDYIRSHTGLKNHPILLLTSTAQDEVNIIVGSGTNTKKHKLVK